MAEQWTPLDISKGLFANVDADAVLGYQTGIENGFITELGGHSRFPGLIERATLADNGRVYLHDFDGDLIAGTSKGQVYRLNKRFDVTNVTEVPVSGGRRTVFAKTDRELLAAAGGPIIRLRDRKTELLSANAPNSTHVGWIDGYTLAIEIDSGRFFHSAAGQPDSWDPLDTFSADGQPDNINSMMITPYREILLGGEDSLEQFERQPTGTVPFFRRWTVGDGVKLPYVMLFADNAAWTINQLTELVRFAGQSSQAASDQIGKLLEDIDDWTDAWMGGFPDNPFHLLGQKFMLLQVPRATNDYGTKGITLLYDYRAKRFSTLYGWDNGNGVPTRWPGWSHWKLWDRTFVGGEGKIYEVSKETYRNGDVLQRWLIRTSHIATTSLIQCKNFRLHIKRGVAASSGAEPIVRVRCRRDGKSFGSWVSRGLGRAGQNVPFVYFGGFGTASSFMFEIACADDCPIELLGVDMLPEPVGH